MDDVSLSFWITIVAGVVFLVSGWATVCVYLAKRSGWMNLSAVYVARQKPAVAQFSWQTVRLDPAGRTYFKSIRFRFAIEGMWLAVTPLLRPGHAPLLVPWDQIEIYTHDVDRADRLYELAFAQVPDVRLRVSAAVAQRFRRAQDNVHYFVQGDAPKRQPA